MKQIPVIFSLAISAFAMSCGTTEEKPPMEAVPVETNTTTDTSEVYDKARNVFYSMPSPLELTNLIKNAGGSYRKDLLNDPNKAGIYHSTQKQALALGLYGADLSYAGVHHQQNDAMKFLAAAKRIGDQLGIQDAFRAELIERANNNMVERDSMLAIMTEMYWHTNSQLKEESRDQIALLVMAGGWAEGIYLGTQFLDEKSLDSKIAQRVAEQVYTSNQLREMFDYYESDPMIQEARPMFQPVFDLFASLELTETDATISKNKKSGVHTIGGLNTISFNPAEMLKLKQLALDLRNEILKP